MPPIGILGLSTESLFTNGLRLDDNKNIIGIDESSLLWTNNGKTEVISSLKRAKRAKSLNTPLVLVGDGSNDLAAFKEGVVDHFIGFGANVERPVVRAEARHFAHSVVDLKTILTSFHY